MTRKWTALLAALALTAALLPSGCSQRSGGITVTETGTQNQSSVPMGRYVEQAWEMPSLGGGNAYIVGIKPAGDGFDIAVSTYKDDTAGIGRYHSADGKTWEAVDADLTARLPIPEGGNACDLDWDDSGAYWAMTESYAQENGNYIKTSKIYTAAPGGEWTEEPIDWEATQAASGSSRSGSIYADSFFRGPDGSFFIGDQIDGIGRFSAEGELLNNYPVMWNGVLLSDRIAKLDSDGGRTEIVYYDLSTEEELERIPVDSAVTGGDYPTLFGGEDGLYLAGNTGLWRMAPGGTLFEQMIQGPACSMGKPALGVGAGCAAPDGTFLLSAREDDKPLLLHYRYDETVPSRPDKELTVASLENQPLVRQAAIEFQVGHPDVSVTVRELYTPDSAMTKSDALRALNTELLAGKGPDVLVLDGMPLRSYEEKGVLADLAPVAEGAGLLTNVALSLGSDGGLFAIPARFRVPMLFGLPGRVEKARTLPQIAATAQEEAGTRLLYNIDPEWLLTQFFPACYPSMEREDGSLDASALTRFLEAVRTLSQSGAGVDFAKDFEALMEENGSGASDPRDALSSEQYATMNRVYSAIRFAFGKVELASLTMNGFNDFRTPYTAVMERMGAAPAPEITPDYLVPLPGMDEGTRVFYPLCILGVNKAGDVDTARQFVAQALSESVQSSRLDGLPVNSAALGNSLDRRTNVSSGWHDPDGGDNELHLECTPAEAQQPLITVFETLNTPFLADDRLNEILAEETKSFFEGGATAEQAAGAVVGRMEAYLTE